MLATPIIGFIVGAGGYMSLAVAKDTYTGKCLDLPQQDILLPPSQVLPF